MACTELLLEGCDLLGRTGKPVVELGVDLVDDCERIADVRRELERNREVIFGVSADIDIVDERHVLEDQFLQAYFVLRLQRAVFNCYGVIKRMHLPDLFCECSPVLLNRGSYT